VTALTYPELLEDYIITQFEDAPYFNDAARDQPLHFTYRTKTADGYQIHIIYNCVLLPQSVSSSTTGSDVDVSPFVFDLVALPVTYGVNLYPHNANRYDTPDPTLLPPPPGSSPEAYEAYYKNRYIEDQIPGLPPFIYDPNIIFPDGFFNDHLDLDLIYPTPHFVFDLGDIDYDKLLSLEDLLYGGEFPTPQGLFDLMLGPNPANFVLPGEFLNFSLNGATAEVAYIPPALVEYSPYQGSRFDTDPDTCSYVVNGFTNHPTTLQLEDHLAVIGDSSTSSYIHLNEFIGNYSSQNNYAWFNLPRQDITYEQFKTLDIWTIRRRCIHQTGNWSVYLTFRLSYPDCGWDYVGPARLTASGDVSKGMAPASALIGGNLLYAFSTISGCAHYDEWRGSSGYRVLDPALYAATTNPTWVEDAWAAYTSVNVGEVSPLKIEITPKPGGGPVDLSFLAVTFGASADPYPSGSDLVEQGTGH
jgi:hypothetical protein